MYALGHYAIHRKLTRIWSNEFGAERGIVRPLDEIPSDHAIM